MLLLFFFNDTATTEIYTLSLHDALPISVWLGHAAHACPRRNGAGAARQRARRGWPARPPSRSQGDAVAAARVPARADRSVSDHGAAGLSAAYRDRSAVSVERSGHRCDSGAARLRYAA